jgi:hypothetical protein
MFYGRRGAHEYSELPANATPVGGICLDVPIFSQAALVWNRGTHPLSQA